MARPDERRRSAPSHTAHPRLRAAVCRTHSPGSAHLAAFRRARRPGFHCVVIHRPGPSLLAFATAAHRTERRSGTKLGRLVRAVPGGLLLNRNPDAALDGEANQAANRADCQIWGRSIEALADRNPDPIVMSTPSSSWLRSPNALPEPRRSRAREVRPVLPRSAAAVWWLGAAAGRSHYAAACHAIPGAEPG
jgi:hypothetical protein